MTRFNDARLAILGRQIPRQHEKDRRVCLANTPQCEYEGVTGRAIFCWENLADESDTLHGKSNSRLTQQVHSRRTRQTSGGREQPRGSNIGRREEDNDETR